MTKSQKISKAMSKINDAYDIERLKELEKAVSENYEEMKEYEYWFDVSSKRYEKTKRAYDDLKEQLNQKQC